MAETNRAYRPGYIYGNAAPKIEESPARVDRKALLRASNARIEARVHAMRRTRTGFTVLQTLAVVLAISACIAAAAFYLVSAFAVESHLSATSRLKKEIQKTERMIDAEEEKIEASLDMEEIYAFAIESGLRLPEKHQIIYYHAQPTEYVINAAVIPND